MTYLALARKWRPRTFSELLGQTHTVKALTNSLKQQKLHHAYLFTGTRGVGKTSVARLFAKALNCEVGISSEPCLQCDACVAIEQGRFIDLLEIDAASRTGVDETRALLDNVQYAPTNARFKIYLIDEVHMLSQHSFNALLKTLEEPPAHVKFLLATTDPQKLPLTVLSRCLQFNLKQVSAEVINHHLRFILEDANQPFEPEALLILSQAAKGSMRDALNLLDQALAGTEEILLTTQVKSILGYTQQDYALELLNAVIHNQVELIQPIIDNINNEGGHFIYVLNEMLSILHQLAMYQLLGNTLKNSTPHSINLLAEQISAEDIQLFYQIGIKGTEEIHLAPSLMIGFTMTVLRMLVFKPVTFTQPPSFALENHTSDCKPPIVAPNHPEPQVIETQSEPKVDNRVIDTPIENWSEIIPHLKLNGLALTALLNSELIAVEDFECKLRITHGHRSLFSPNVCLRVEESLSVYYKKKIKLVLSCEDSLNATPAIQHQQEEEKSLKNAELNLQNDPIFQQLQEEFSADLIKNSVVSV